MLSSKYQECIDACYQCLVDCQVCLTAMAGKESKNDCPNCCVECIDACYACIKSMAADSKWAEEYCRICAAICDWCAKQCVEHDHEHCQKCAASCRKCAELCRDMVAQAA